MFVKALLLGVLSVVHSQDQCIYSANDGNYVLNLTSVSQWTLEYQGSDHWYYYTPCRNGLNCVQGNANFYANAAQYNEMGIDNQCTAYLAVDHHEAAQYSFIGGAWMFHYEDGELCDSTQQPRSTAVYFHCNDVNNEHRAQLVGVNEPSGCHYAYSIASTLACVPENIHNANCQWRTPNGTGGYYYLDLSALKGQVAYEKVENGFVYHHSICANGLRCYQQDRPQVMSAIFNGQTNTCDLTMAVWEEGQVQPLLHQEADGDATHWTFHYFNGQTCPNGEHGYEKVRFFCDATVDTYKVLGAYGEGNCRFDMNISTKAACLDQVPKWVDAKQWFQKKE
eukprot:66768_1